MNLITVSSFDIGSTRFVVASRSISIINESPEEVVSGLEELLSTVSTKLTYLIFNFEIQLNEFNVVRF